MYRRSCHLIIPPQYQGMISSSDVSQHTSETRLQTTALTTKTSFHFPLQPILYVFSPHNSQFKYLISISPGVSFVPDPMIQLSLSFYFHHFNSHSSATILSTHSDVITVIFHGYVTYTLCEVLSSYTTEHAVHCILIHLSIPILYIIYSYLLLSQSFNYATKAWRLNNQLPRWV